MIYLLAFGGSSHPSHLSPHTVQLGQRANTDSVLIVLEENIEAQGIK